jgi:deoxyribonuclease V
MIRVRKLHPWKVSVQEAMEIQEHLRGEVVTADDMDPIGRVAGIDVGFEEGGGITRAAVVVLSFPDLDFCEQSVARLPTMFPYVPGLLSFRETPAALAALVNLRRAPDLLLCDGQGLAHPRRFGLACHIGVLCDIPTIGVAKTRLQGSHEPVPLTRGAWEPLVDAGEVIGAVLRTRTGVKPVYVSIGHKVSLPTAIDFVLQCAPRYRLPEPARRAHRLASAPRPDVI